MFFLPRGIPLFENLDTAKLILPDVLDKLHTAGFGGYVSFRFPSATVTMGLEAGKLGCALFEGPLGDRKRDREALEILADLMLSVEGGIMDVYRLSPRLCACIGALLRGNVRYRAQELKLLNMRVLLQQISDERITGCLRTYTTERSSLIFYQEGSPVGFFHDGASDLEMSVTESQRIPPSAGAKIDLYATPALDQPLEGDLCNVVDIKAMWERALARHRNGRGNGVSPPT